MEIRGRFAPSPSGRMHLGNLFASMLAWLDVRSLGGKMVLRIEDLDTERCTMEYAALLMDDLRWMGMDWDEFGEENYQSRRTALYDAAFEKLRNMGLLYPCYCSRAERLAASAPHRDDGTVVYNGRCRNLTDEQRAALERAGKRPAWRVAVPDRTVSVRDGHYGDYEENLARDCGDYLIRRSDGVYSYQLAAAVDDGEMGVTRVVRGYDLLGSAPRQKWLMETLGYRAPDYAHAPLLVAPDGRRLSKRDRDLAMDGLRERYSPEELTGLLACWAGLQDSPKSVAISQLIPGFSWAKVPKNEIAVRLP